MPDGMSTIGQTNETSGVMNRKFSLMCHTLILWSVTQEEMSFWRSVREEKKFHDWTWAALNLQPSDLRSNAYRSING